MTCDMYFILCPYVWIREFFSLTTGLSKKRKCCRKTSSDNIHLPMWSLCARCERVKLGAVGSIEGFFYQNIKRLFCHVNVRETRQPTDRPRKRHLQGAQHFQGMLSPLPIICMNSLIPKISMRSKF